jgi:hypothetical protein
LPPGSRERGARPVRAFAALALARGLARGALAFVTMLAVTAQAALAAFERPATGPAAAALGGVVAVSDDPVFGNPAGAGPLPVSLPGAHPPARSDACPAARSDARPLLAGGLWAARPFGLSELQEVQGWGRLSLSSLAAGIGFRRFGSPVYAEKEIRVTIAFRRRAGISLGGALRALSVGGPALPALRSLVLDLGLRAQPEPETELGAVVQCLAGTLPGDPDARLARTCLGASRRLPGGLRLLAELSRREDRPGGVLGGVSWCPQSALTLRVGFREEPRALTWGFSLVVAGLAVDVSGTEMETLSRTLQIGLTAGSSVSSAR